MKAIEPGRDNIGSAVAKEAIRSLIASVHSMFATNGAEAVKIAHEALSLAEPLGDAKIIAECNVALGLACFATNQYELGEIASRKAVETFRQLHDPANVARTLNNLGTSYDYRGEYAKALQCFDESSAIAHDIADETIEAEALYKTGVAYYRQSDYESSLEHLFRGYQLYGRTNDKIGQARILNNIGTLFAERKEYDDAMRYFNQCLAIARTIDMPPLEIALLNNIGNTHKVLGDIDQAREFFTQGVELARKTGHLTHSIDLLLNLGTLSQEELDYSSAKGFADQALKIAEDHGYNRLELHSLCELGTIYEKQGRLDDAVEVLSRALTIAGRMDAPAAEERVREVYARLCETRHEYPDALAHFKRFHELRERVMSDANERAQRRMLVRFEVERGKIEREEIRRRNEELAHALETQAALNRALEDMSKEKSDIIGIVAHDLRDPIASIKMISSLLQDPSISSHDARQFVHAIQSACDRTLELITSLLSMNAIESGKMKFEYEMLNPCTIIENVLTRFATAAAEKSVSLHFTPAAVAGLIKTDKNALREIMENLISNAIKYTPREKNVFITSSIENTMYRFVVRNEGQGIRAEDHEKMFQKFSRLSATPTGGEPSSGLGLFIVKKIVDALRGSIHCESTPGVYAAFIVELPVQ